MEEEDDAALSENAYEDFDNDNDATNDDDDDEDDDIDDDDDAMDAAAREKTPRMTETAVAAHDERTRAMERGADDSIGRLWRGELGFTASVRTAIFLWVILW